MPKHDSFNYFLNTQFIQAVESSHYSLVAKLVADGANVNHEINLSFKTTLLALDDAAQAEQSHQVLFPSYSPLMLAIKAGSTAIATLLITHGAEVNYTNNSGDTALILAVIYYNKEMVELLLTHGADINAVNSMGFSALNYCLNSLLDSDGALFNFLVSCGADVFHQLEGKSLLYLAINDPIVNNFNQIYTLLMHGLSLGDADYSYNIFTFIAQQNMPQTKLLLSNSEACNLSLTNGLTPLMLASGKNLDSFVSILLSSDTKPLVLDRYGWSALHYASYYGAYQSASLLLETPLLLHPPVYNPLILVSAVHGGSYQLLKKLLDFGYQTSLIAALCRATLTRRLDMIELLLIYIDDINDKDFYDEYPLDCAMRIDFKQAINLFKAHGAIGLDQRKQQWAEQKQSPNLQNSEELNFK